METIARLVRFGAVGTAGFAVDAAVLSALTSLGGMDVYPARAVSFIVACSATWLLNRTFVFAPVEGAERGGPREREYARYFSVQTAGALINLAVFAALIQALPGMRALPVLPLAAGSVVAMVFNYAGARYWVFRIRP
jgi:putative flippase GtrA